MILLLPWLASVVISYDKIFKLKYALGDALFQERDGLIERYSTHP